MPLNPHFAVYTGSFDPLTLGHLDIIRRGSKICERLTVGIGINPDKTPLFTPDERVELIQDTVAEFGNVEVKCFRGLAVDFVQECGAAVMLRGVRSLTDIEAEFTMTLANRALCPEIETVFLMASESYTHISSTLIKQIAHMAGADASEQLQRFVPQQVIAPLLSRTQS